MSCLECLYVLDLILLAEVPATPEEEAILDEIPEVTAEDVLERLRPRIAWSGCCIRVLDSLLHKSLPEPKEDQPQTTAHQGSHHGDCKTL